EPGMSIVCAIVPLSPASRLFPYTTLFRSGRDSARFLAAGARRSFWLRTKHGFLAEGLPLLRTALGQIGPDPNGEMIPLILESNRSEEHTSELQSRGHLVCRRPLAKKKTT